MEPITDSAIRERFRLHNYQEAQAKELKIRQQLESDIKSLPPLPPLPKKKLLPSIGAHIGLGIGIGVTVGYYVTAGLYYAIFSNNDNQSFFAILFFLFILVMILSVGLAIVIWKKRRTSIEAYNRSIKNANDSPRASLEKQIKQLKQQAQQLIDQAYFDADIKTKNEIKQYDQEVAAFFQKIKNHVQSLDRLADYAGEEFDKAVNASITKAANMERFIELDFDYEVTRVNILFRNSFSPNSIFDFKTYRYRNLSKDSECEALAAAVYKIIGGHIKKKYGAAYGVYTYTKNDAQVKISFKMPNKSFVPATVIT